MVLLCVSAAVNLMNECVSHEHTVLPVFGQYNLQQRGSATIQPKNRTPREKQNNNVFALRYSNDTHYSSHAVSTRTKAEKIPVREFLEASGVQG